MKYSAIGLPLATLLFASGAILTAQTVVNGGRTQIGPWDASGAVYTIPAQRGTIAQLPATCIQGAEYFATNATPGQNIYLCTSTNTWTQQSGGSAGSYSFRNNLTNTSGTVDFTPLDSSVLNLVDDFMPGKNSSAMIGQLQWGISQLGASCGNGYSTGVANHPGVYLMQANTTSGNGCVISLSDPNSSDLNSIANLGSGGAWSYWESQAILLTDPNSVAAVRYLAGFTDHNNSYHPAGGNQIAVRYDPAGGGCPSGESTVDWVYEVIVAGTQTCYDSGVAVAANTWYHTRIYSSAPGAIQFQINQANSGSIATAPTAAMAPEFLIQGTGTSSKLMYVDWWAMKMQGLTR